MLVLVANQTKTWTSLSANETEKSSYSINVHFLSLQASTLQSFQERHLCLWSCKFCVRNLQDIGHEKHFFGTAMVALQLCSPKTRTYLCASSLLKWPLANSFNIVPLYLPETSVNAMNEQSTELTSYANSVDLSLCKTHFIWWRGFAICTTKLAKILSQSGLVPLLVGWFLSLGASLDLLFSTLHFSSVTLRLQLIF